MLFKLTLLLPTLTVAQETADVVPGQTIESFDMKDMPADHEELGAQNKDHAMWDEQFAQMDLDGDGYLSRDEVMLIFFCFFISLLVLVQEVFYEVGCKKPR